VTLFTEGYAAQWRGDASEKPDTSLDIRPPVGEEWTIKLQLRADSNIELAIAPASSGIVLDRREVEKEYYNFVLTNDCYLKIKTALAKAAAVRYLYNGYAKKITTTAVS
jgi:hypothetical protein